MNGRRGADQRTGLLVLTGAMVASTALYGAILVFLFRQRGPWEAAGLGLRPVFWALSALALVASVALVRRRLAAARDAGEARAAALLALAAAEAAAVFGFVSAAAFGALPDFVVSAALAVAFMLGVVLPAALRAGAANPAVPPPVEPR